MNGRRGFTRIGVVASALLMLAACGDPAPDGDADATPTPTSPSPTPISSEAATALLDRVVITGMFAGIPQIQDPGHTTGADDVECVQEELPESLANRATKFAQEGTTAFVEMHQITTVYATANDAVTVLDQTMDAHEQCAQRVTAGQVTTDYARTSIPESVGLGARGVRATMTLTDTGRQFPHRYGCLTRGPVLQCVQVWTPTEADAQRSFEAGLAATADNLRAQLPG